MSADNACARMGLVVGERVRIGVQNGNPGDTQTMSVHEGTILELRRRPEMASLDIVLDTGIVYVTSHTPYFVTRVERGDPETSVKREA